MSSNPELWLIEDSDEDAEVFGFAAESTALPARVRRFDSAEAAHAALDEGERPSLVVMDLNLPGREGGGLLHDFRGREDLRSAPLLVLSSSARPADRERSLAAGATAYIVKPLGIARYEELLRAIKDFWFIQASI